MQVSEKQQSLSLSPLLQGRYTPTLFMSLGTLSVNAAAVQGNAGDKNKGNPGDNSKDTTTLDTPSTLQFKMDISANDKPQKVSVAAKKIIDDPKLLESFKPEQLKQIATFAKNHSNALTKEGKKFAELARLIENHLKLPAPMPTRSFINSR